ncbi:hypothetical protein V5799_013493 [Amblyomma americanum]|uniref:Lipocalin-5 1 n=1 Tax=Amblyomma americanum TaxID=6943 RepID=A0AAQ4E5R7_AMBAM
MVWLKVGFGLLLFALASAVPPGNRRRDPTDLFKLYTAFPNAVAIFTSSNHSSFKCLTATRRAFDPKAKTATYVWHFKGHSGHKRKDVSFHLFREDTPGQDTYYLNDDKSREYTVIYEYTDYKTCVVLKLPYENHDHCMLWVRRSVINNVPKDCLENYEDICDVRVPLNDKNLCKDDDE